MTIKFQNLFPLRQALLDDSHDVIPINSEPKKETKKILSATTLNKKNPKNSSSKLYLLIVEDNLLAATAARSIITESNCIVDVAENGLKALKLFDENNYDLIFMDIGLPNFNGFETTKHIRAKEWRRDTHIPIIALTAHIDSENKQKCIESGMDAVLSKPLMRKTAEDILNAFAPAKKKTNNIKSKNMRKNLDNENILTITGDVIDLDMGIAKMGDLKSAIDMIELLKVTFKEDVPRLNQARKENDWQQIKFIVHKQRGGSTYCGVPRFQQITSYLDDYLTQEKTENLPELFAHLLDEIKKIINHSIEIN